MFAQPRYNGIVRIGGHTIMASERLQQIISSKGIRKWTAGQLRSCLEGLPQSRQVIVQRPTPRLSRAYRAHLAGSEAPLLIFMPDASYDHHHLIWLYLAHSYLPTLPLHIYIYVYIYIERERDIYLSLYI